MKRYILSIILCLTASCAWAFPPGFTGAVASSGGVTHPSAGATLAGGNDSMSGVISNLITANNEVGTDEGYLATWPETSLSEEAAGVEVYAFRWVGGSIKIIIRSSSGKLIATSAATSVDGWPTSPAWHFIPLPVTITKGETYRITINQSNNYVIKYHYTDSTASVRYRAASYDYPPEYPALPTLQAASKSMVIRIIK